MSERMIPLRIADMAVEACNKEIQELRTELARLRASSFVTAVPVEQYERVIKAGDELLNNWISNEGLYHETEDAKERWEAAKEGKQP